MQKYVLEFSDVPPCKILVNYLRARLEKKIYGDMSGQDPWKLKWRRLMKANKRATL